MFLVNIEVTIVSTSLVAITNDLGGYDQTGWLVSGYLATYSCTLLDSRRAMRSFRRMLTFHTSIYCRLGKAQRPDWAKNHHSRNCCLFYFLFHRVWCIAVNHYSVS